LQAGITRRDRRDLAREPAETLGDGELAAALGHQLHTDADAKKRLPPTADSVFERLFHARNGGEAAPAIGECADTGQHDALGLANQIGVARYRDRRGDAAL